MEVYYSQQYLGAFKNSWQYFRLRRRKQKMVVNEEKIVENKYKLKTLKDLPEMLNDWGYNWVYLPSREKYQITLGYALIELYVDNSLEVNVEFVESEKYQYGNDFALLICRLVKNGYIKESENGKLN